jgi:hypothetical protein
MHIVGQGNCYVCDGNLRWNIKIENGIRSTYPPGAEVLFIERLGNGKQYQLRVQITIPCTCGATCRFNALENI